MNIFRLAGDMTHLASVLVLLLKIHTIKSCAGISLKTQELYAVVFATRYLDLFTHYVSLYNTLMKIIFLVSSFSIVWYMRRHKIVRRSYDKDQDTFRHYFLVVPCFVIALVINEKFTFKEVMWAFSLYLEAVAILPQLVLLQRTRNIDNLTGQYVFLLGAYRSLYILNWIYRYFTQPHYVHWICILGFQDLSRPCSMLISFIITSKAGRITRSLNYLLELVFCSKIYEARNFQQQILDSLEGTWHVVLLLPKSYCTMDFDKRLDMSGCSFIIYRLLPSDLDCGCKGVCALNLQDLVEAEHMCNLFNSQILLANLLSVFPNGKGTNMLYYTYFLKAY